MAARSRFAWALACMLALAGCVTAGQKAGVAALAPAPAPLDIPASWYRETPANGSPELGTWWQRFDDPQLTALVNQALARNTSLAAAAARLQQARALRDLAGAGLSTQVSASASAENVRQRGFGSQSSYSAGLDASWEPDLYGYRKAGLAASAAALDAQALTLADGQVSVAAEVALTYIALRGVQQREAVADTHVKRQLILTLLAAQRMNEDGGLDRDRARAALALSMAELPRWRASRSQLEHSLALLCGGAPGALAPSLSTGTAVPRAPDGLAMSLPADTLRQRPDVRAAAARVDAALARLGQADAARKPVVRLEGSIGLHGIGFGGSGSVLRGLFGAVSGVAFDGGAGRARVAAEQAAVQESYAAYHTAVLAALRDVEDALVDLAAARERRTALRAAAEIAANAANLALLAYVDGKVEVDAVLAIHATLLESEDALVLAEVAHSAAHVRLYKALGGGWQPTDTP
ncbi:efflux transporter outer membrane subunit [Pseudoduganella eburnea]|uniref:Efflux transporter outer membrane subunit n=1 Tax=Massilia eburnea TaxID=1776165 RepID=A0A6L6QEA0_9BURK|nr:efflux transporter outer membrane subunit [Massilia eburnea]MTW10013.1 efflux transporter outer membrane subunit [Massilia eburnea]